ncbi:hypothetical protein IFM89_033221, partial [Coptis chinensis]
MARYRKAGPDGAIPVSVKSEVGLDEGGDPVSRAVGWFLSEAKYVSFFRILFSVHQQTSTLNMKPLQTTWSQFLGPFITQIRTHSNRREHENIDKTLKASDVILGQFDLSRQ